MLLLATACLGGGLLPSCETEKSSATTETRGEWRTREWPMARGAKELQGRVKDPVPRNPAITWTFRAKGAVSSEAAIANGLIVFGTDEGQVHALDLNTRSERWRVATMDAVEATPLILDNRVFAGSNDHTFRALDPTTGRELWHVNGEEKFPTGGIPNGTGRILVNGYDGISRCLDAKDGALVWKHETQDYINGSPAVIDGGLVAFGGCDSVIHIIHLKDGSAANQVKSDAQIIRSLAAWGDIVYGVNFANQLIAFDVKSDKPAWIYECDGAQFSTSPGVDEERVYVGSRDKQLHAVDRATGKSAWKYKTGGRIESSPLVFDDAVVFGSGDGRLHAVDPRDGSVIWQLDLGENLPNAPAFADGRIVIGGGDGNLFVIGETPRK